MSKKKEVTSDINYRIAIEEFFFVVEQSMEIIYPSLGFIGELKTVTNKEKVRLESNINSFYFENKTILYSNADVVLNGLVRFNSEKGELLLVDSDGKYINMNEDSSLLQLFQNKDVIKELRVLAENSIKKQKSKEEFIYRLRKNIYRLECMLDHINKLPLILKLWRELLLGESEKLLTCLVGKNTSGNSLRIRTLILKSFIEATEIKPATEVNKQKFIAEILGTTSKSVKTSFSNFEKENMDLKKEGEFEDQIDYAKEVCKYLRNIENSKGELIINKMIDSISLAGVSKTKK